MRRTLAVEGMHRGSCVGRVGAALRGVPGVSGAEAALDPPRAEVQAADGVGFTALDAAVRGAGDDLLAWRPAARAWAWAYAFVGLGLAAAYRLGVFPLATSLVKLAPMLRGAAGVLGALLDRRAIRRACLGTALNLPMTEVTLVGDLLMAGMAAAVLAAHGSGRG